MHLAKENVLSTFSKVFCPSRPIISRSKAATTHLRTSWSPIIFEMCLGLVTSDRVDVHAGQEQCGTFHAPVPHHWPTVLLPLPMLLQQLCHHHLKLLIIESVNTSHMQLTPACTFFLFLQTKNDTRCVPL